VSTKSNLLAAEVGIACACAGCVCDGEVGLGGTAVDGDHRVVLPGYAAVRDMCGVKSHCAENYYSITDLDPGIKKPVDALLIVSITC
jgi:hypothetical protein